MNEQSLREHISSIRAHLDAIESLLPRDEEVEMLMVRFTNLLKHSMIEPGIAHGADYLFDQQPKSLQALLRILDSQGEGGFRGRVLQILSRHVNRSNHQDILNVSLPLLFHEGRITSECATMAVESCLPFLDPYESARVVDVLRQVQDEMAARGRGINSIYIGQMLEDMTTSGVDKTGAA